MDRIEKNAPSHVPDGMTETKAGNRRYASVALLGLMAVLSGLLLVNPASVNALPSCPFHWLTGLKCPGCGSMRAMHLLLQGSIGAALSQNVLAVIMLPVIVLDSVVTRLTKKLP